MPISSGPRSNSAVKREREILLQRAEQEKQERLRRQEQDGDGDLARLGRRVEAEAESARAERRKEYDRAVSATASVPLQKLALSPCGVALFDELCLRVDVNQRYAECLPQWGDLARALDVDELKTRWVEACVRPSEGLTRAILEIYMRDGGTLGEVLGALLRLELLQVMEKLMPKVRAFLKEREEEEESGSEEDNVGMGSSSSGMTAHPKFFSLLATLVQAFGEKDPCFAIQKMSSGLKMLQQQQQQQQYHVQLQQQQGRGTELTHTLVVQGSADDGVGGLSKDPPFLFSSSAFDLSKRGGESTWDLALPKKGGKEDGDDGERPSVCRILLINSSDGSETAEEVYRMLQGFEHDGVRAEVFRLSESSLWYEVLTNPEACCMKWAAEADYVMPVLTQGFLQEIHSKTPSGDSGLLPTSPLLNKFMYNLLRARYAEGGCRNTMVRPVVPRGAAGAAVTGCAAVKTDLLLRMAWVVAEEERLAGRARGMLTEVAKRHSVAAAAE